jgi:hypothetical protein
LVDGVASKLLTGMRLRMLSAVMLLPWNVTAVCEKAKPRPEAHFFHVAVELEFHHPV